MQRVAARLQINTNKTTNKFKTKCHIKNRKMSNNKLDKDKKSKNYLLVYTTSVARPVVFRFVV